MPDLGDLRGPETKKQHIVDHSFLRRPDGKWTLWACIRGAGPGRLLYGWEGESLTSGPWHPLGVVARAEAAWGENAGQRSNPASGAPSRTGELAVSTQRPEAIQAPHFLQHGDGFLCFYNSAGIRLMTSRDGLHFTRRGVPPDGNLLYPDGGRDIMVLPIGGVFHAYSTISTQDNRAHISLRTSRDLQVWSPARNVCAGGRGGVGVVSAESPFVVALDGFYYLFRASSNDGRTYVYRSLTPDNFGVNDDAKLIAVLLLKAPEVIHHEGEWFVSDLADFQGIQLRRLVWRAATADPEPPVDQMGAAAQKLTVALLQMRPEGHDLQANQRKAERFCRQAAAQGADVALMPEMWSIGYTRFAPDGPLSKDELFARAVATDSDFVQGFARLAQELNLAIAVTYLQAWPGAPRNAVTLLDRHGREVFTYAKVHTSDMKALESAMTPGEEFVVGALDTAHGAVNVGAMICFDREQPESARLLMLKGAEIILTPNSCTLDDRRQAQFMVRGMENVAGVAMTNYPAPKNNGRSVAYDYRSSQLVEAGPEEGLFLATFDITRLREARRSSIWGGAYRRPHRYRELSAPQTDAAWRRTNGLGQPFHPEER
ncbi:MAG: hypothetical protein MUC88_25600 [Planctomycetes bacterium]|nr:hypothetical protein [Planctomycetota bacterium]